MTITINGITANITTAAGRITLDALLRQNGITPEKKGIAVALNDEVIPKRLWIDTWVTGSDRLEIIQASQGG
jgi:sulfur carrier protein